MYSVDELLLPVPFAEFANTALGTTHLLVPGTRGKLCGLVSWKTLNAALEEHRLEPPRLRLAHAGRRADELTFIDHEVTRRGERVPRLRLADLLRHLRSGATLVLDAVDELFPSVRALAEAFCATFRAHVQVNLYASFGQDPGFGLHWDDHDVFVLQLEGEKWWEMYGGARAYPQFRDVEENVPPVTAVWEGVVRAGDVLYVPRGHWHNVRGRNGASLHLTVGVNRKTRTDLLGWLRDEARGLEAFRMDLPTFASADEKARHARLLRDELLRLWSDDVVARYLASSDRLRIPRYRLGLPAAALGDGLPDATAFAFESTLPYPPSMQTEGDDVILTMSGREWRFARVSQPLLTLLFSGTLVSFESLAEAAPSIPVAKTRRMLATLVSEGLIHVVLSD